VTVRRVVPRPDGAVGTYPRGMDRRRRAVAAAALAAVLVVVGVIGAMTGSDTEPEVGGPVPPEKMQVEVSDDGIAFIVRTSFPETLALSRPRAQVGGTDMRAYLLPEGKQRRGNRAHRRVVIPVGTDLAIAGILVPRCAGGVGPVGFTVTARPPGGEPAVQRIGVSNAWLLRQAVNEWCHRPPRVRLSSCRFGADGKAEIHMLVRNHGPDELSVEIPAYDGPKVTWEPVTTRVAVGEEADIVLRGTKVDEGDPTSWGDGRMLLDGEPFHVRSDDSYCG
jgi:hypothetical protein